MSVVDGERVLADAVDAYQAALGERLLAAYALGSLAHGGFSGLVSDVDLGLIVRDPGLPEDDATIRVVAEGERSRGTLLHERLSVFWGTPSTLGGKKEGGRFPALDRLDLLENGRLLTGVDVRHSLPRPGYDEIVIEGAEFALDHLARVGPSADPGSRRAGGEGALEEIRSPDVLLARGVRPLTKTVLFPVRFLYTAATGRVGTNHAAVAWYLERPAGPGTALVKAALAWRAAGPTDSEAAIELLRSGLVPLYVHYLDDQVERLALLGRADLARAFEEWRDRLVERSRRR